MQGKKIIISALIIIAGGFIGFLLGLLIPVDLENKFKIDFSVENQISGIEVYLNDKLIGEIDSSGFMDFSQVVKQGTSLKFSMKKSGCIVLPETKSFLITRDSENNHLKLRVFPNKPPVLSVNIKDWRGNKVKGAQILINENPLKINTDMNGKAVIPLKDFPLGSVLQLDAKHGKMNAFKGNNEIVITADTVNFIRNITLYQRPENWIEFSITSQGTPVRKARIIRDGKKVQIKYKNNKYIDWLHDINKSYTYTISALGYITKKIIVTPTQKGQNKWNIVLDKIEFNLRVKDKSGVNKNMEDVVIFNSRGKEIGRTNSLGMAVNLPSYSLNKIQSFFIEKKPEFRKQKIMITIRKNHETQTVYIKPFVYERFISVIWENEKPATNTIVTLKNDNGYIQSVKLDNKGYASFSDSKIKPNQDYTIVVETEYGKKEVADSPTEYELKRKSRKIIKFERKGTINIVLKDGATGTIDIYNTKNEKVANGLNKLYQKLMYGNYIIKVKGRDINIRKDIAFFEENKKVVIDLTDPCEKLMMKIKNNPDYLTQAKGKNDLENIYNLIDEKIGNSKISECETQVIRMYADLKYNEKDYFSSTGAFKLLINHIKGADRKAVNLQRYGRSNLYYVIQKTDMEIDQKMEFVDIALENFSNAETKISQSINKKFRRKFTTELYFDKAEAMTTKYELIKTAGYDNSGLFKKKAKDAWDSFLFQYSKCNSQLQSDLKGYKKVADNRLEELR